MRGFTLKAAILEVLEGYRFPIAKDILRDKTEREYGTFAERNFLHALRQLKDLGKVASDEYGYALKRGR